MSGYWKLVSEGKNVLGFSRFWQGFVVFCAFMTLISPPGLCTCWLSQDIQIVHVHFSKSHAESRHPHDYLLQMSQTLQVEITPFAIMPIGLVIALEWMGSIWRRVGEASVHKEGWKPVIPLPPPK